MTIPAICVTLLFILTIFVCIPNVLYHALIIGTEKIGEAAASRYRGFSNCIVGGLHPAVYILDPGDEEAARCPKGGRKG